MASEISRVNAPTVAGMPSFSHASVAGRNVYVSGVLGTLPGTQSLADGVPGQTTQALRNIETILAECGCRGFADALKLTVYLTRMDEFAAMNDAYIGVVGPNPPARMTLGVTALALGAAVEIDCIAYRPGD